MNTNTAKWSPSLSAYAHGFLHVCQFYTFVSDKQLNLAEDKTILYHYAGTVNGTNDFIAGMKAGANTMTGGAFALILLSLGLSLVLNLWLIFFITFMVVSLSYFTLSIIAQQYNRRFREWKNHNVYSQA